MSGEATLEMGEWESLLAVMTGRLQKAQKILAVAAQTFAFQDIMSHFESEVGPEGRWKPWAEATRRAYEAKGWGGNKILQATGTMRQSIVPRNIENVGDDAIRIFSAVKYSRRHDEGTAGMPKRPFMWTSQSANDKMADLVVKTVIGELTI